ncbi:MAG: hypothetical protein ACTSRZ_18275 [Promethearchaeota archaeon]
MSQNEEKKSKKSIKVQIHTRISKEASDAIEELSKITGSKAKVIEDAVLFYKKYKTRWDKSQQIWNKARELQMVLVGKTTFMSYISGDISKVWEENICTEVIEWITKKHLKDLTILEIMNAIKDMWVAANYFKNVEIRELEANPKTYEMRFYHNFNKKYSEFWANYFRKWFKDNLKCNVECSIRNELFILFIKYL